MGRRALNAAVAALVAQHAVGMPAGRLLAMRAAARPQTTSTATGPVDAEASTGTNSGASTDTVVVYTPAHSQSTTTNYIPYGRTASTVTQTGSSADTVVIYSPSAVSKTHVQTTETSTLDHTASPYTSTAVGRGTEIDTVIIGSPNPPPPTVTVTSTIENGSQASSYTSGGTLFIRSPSPSPPLPTSTSYTALPANSQDYVSTVSGIEIHGVPRQYSYHTTTLPAGGLGYTTTSGETVYVGTPVQVHTTTTTTLGANEAGYVTTSNGVEVIGSPGVYHLTTSTTVTSATATRPSLPIYTPIDGGTLSCPLDFGSNYTVASTGDVYQVTCYTDHQSNDLSLAWAFSLDGCATKCSQTEKCTSVVWRPRSVDGPCYMKTKAVNPSSDGGLMGLILLKKGAGLSSISTPLTSMPLRTITTIIGTTTVLGPPTTTSTVTLWPSSTSEPETSNIPFFSGPETSTSISRTLPAYIPAGSSSSYSEQPFYTQPDIRPYRVTGHKTTDDYSTETTSSSVLTYLQPSFTPPSRKFYANNRLSSLVSSSSRAPTTPSPARTTASSNTSLYINTPTTEEPPPPPRTTQPTYSSPSTATTLTVLANSTANPISPSGGPWIPCGPLNHQGNKFYMRTHVIYGPKEFENLYVQYIPYNSPATIPKLNSSRATAAQAYYDYSTSSVAIWHGECRFSGLTMVPNRNMNAWSSVFISDEVGTALMTTAAGEVWWSNDRFGSWLACRSESAVLELFWWDVVTGKGVDSGRCAKVQLLTENL